MFYTENSDGFQTTLEWNDVNRGDFKQGLAVVYFKKTHDDENWESRDER